MKNRVTLLANLLKTNLIKEGYEFISQKAYPLTEGIILQFSKNGKSITDNMIKVNCSYRLEIRKDDFLIYLF